MFGFSLDNKTVATEHVCVRCLDNLYEYTCGRFESSDNYLDFFKTVNALAGRI